MHKLIYCEFEQIIGQYYKPVNKDELSKTLLKAGLEEPEYGCVDRIDKHQLSKIRRISGGVDVNKDIVEFYYDKGAEERTRKYFQTRILGNIGKSYYLDLINDVAVLIMKDSTIDGAQAGEFLGLAEKAKGLIMSAMAIMPADMPGRTAKAVKENEALTAMAGYLAKVFIHCIQHKREAKYIFPPPFHNLMPQNIQFTGRGEVLQELTENFRAGRYIQILSGMPGVGKTQVALQYAYENMHKYDIIWWVNAENEATLLEACSIFLHSQNVSAIDSIAIRFCNFFERYDGSWLLIYDNVQYSTSEQIRLLNAYIPKNNRAGRILMTSRWQNRFNGILPKNIDVFMPDEAVEFLQQNIEAEDIIGAGDLAKRLGYLPLPLSYSAAYINQTPHCNCVKYLKMLSDRGAGLFEYSSDIKLDNYNRTIRETFMISISKFTEEAEKEDEFMKGVEQFIYASAYFPSYSIDLNFIRNLCPEALYPELYEIMNDDILQDKLVRVLTSCSLYYVASSSDSDSIYGGAILGMHKLLQDVIISLLPPVFPKEWDHFYNPFPTTVQAGIFYVEDTPPEIQQEPMHLLTELIFQKCAYVNREQPHDVFAASIVINARRVLRNLKFGISGEVFNEASWLESGNTLEELEDYLDSLDSFMLKFMHQYYHYCETFVKVALPSCGYLVGIKPLSEYTPDVAEEIVRSIAIAIFSHAVPSYPSSKEFSKNRVLARFQASTAQAGNIILTELLDSMEDVIHSQSTARMDIFNGSALDILKRIINIQKTIQMQYFEKGTGLYSITNSNFGDHKICLLSASPHLAPEKKFELVIFLDSLGI